MIGEANSAYQLALDRIRRDPEAAFRWLSALVLVAVLSLLAAKGLEDEEVPPLPIEFRLEEPKLSNLPVRIDRIRSCSCWHGPRDQAQRKYKFRVVNETDQMIDIGGGPRSVLRLIVAYPNRREPRMTMPAPADYQEVRQLQSPPDLRIPVSGEIAQVRPNRIRGSNAFFGVPRGHSLWALPPSPNKLVEMMGSEEASFPTVVDTSRLLPGEEYQGDRLGHGTWTFYIPLPHRFAQSFATVAEPVLPREVYERHVIFVGIAALMPGADGVRLLGFAPAPSENALASPSDL